VGMARQRAHPVRADPALASACVRRCKEVAEGVRVLAHSLCCFLFFVVPLPFLPPPVPLAGLAGVVVGLRSDIFRRHHPDNPPELAARALSLVLGERTVGLVAPSPQQCRLWAAALRTACVPRAPPPPEEGGEANADGGTAGAEGTGAAAV